MVLMAPKKSGNIFYIIIAILAVIAASYLFQIFSYYKQSIIAGDDNGHLMMPPGQMYHVHADFKVFLSGKELNFNIQKFDVANPFMHMHLNNPDGNKIIHIEGMPNATLSIFFESLGMKFNSTCFIPDDGTTFCNEGDKRFRMFVNGKENFDFDLYSPQDTDRILITYGKDTDNEIKKQMDSVTDDACLYSRKCPERIPELPSPEGKLAF